MNCVVEEASFKMCVTLPSITPRSSQETSALFHRVQKVMFLSCDWWISIHSVCFCFKMTVRIMIDGSIKPNRMSGFELQSSHVIERPINCLSKLKLPASDFQRFANKISKSYETGNEREDQAMKTAYWCTATCFQTVREKHTRGKKKCYIVTRAETSLFHSHLSDTFSALMKLGCRQQRRDSTLKYNTK